MNMLLEAGADPTVLNAQVRSDILRHESESACYLMGSRVFVGSICS
jgi:hypothetical protein